LYFVFAFVVSGGHMQQVRADNRVGMSALNYSEGIERFSRWKVRLEDIVVDVKAKLANDQAALIGAKWLYDDARAHINGLIERMIVDLRQRGVPHEVNPYRTSIVEADKRVKAFVNHANDVLFVVEITPGEWQGQFAFEGWKAVESFLGPAISLVTAILERLPDSRYSEMIEHLERLKLRPFQDI
jgi:hypothetical protein